MKTWLIHYAVSTDAGRMFRHTYVDQDAMPQPDEARLLLAELEDARPDQVLVRAIGEHNTGGTNGQR